MFGLLAMIGCPTLLSRTMKTVKTYLKTCGWIRLSPPLMRLNKPGSYMQKSGSMTAPAPALKALTFRCQFDLKKFATCLKTDVKLTEDARQRYLASLV